MESKYTKWVTRLIKFNLYSLFFFIILIPFFKYYGINGYKNSLEIQVISGFILGLISIIISETFSNNKNKQ